VAVGGLQGLSERAAGRLRRLAGRRLSSNDEIHLTAEESRSQAQNREQVLRRLRELIVAAQHEPKPRRKTRPSRAAKRRRLEAKRLQGEKKAKRRAVEG
jgi:ribosome-associated protein